MLGVPDGDPSLLWSVDAGCQPAALMDQLRANCRGSSHGPRVRYVNMWRDGRIDSKQCRMIEMRSYVYIKVYVGHYS